MTQRDIAQLCCRALAILLIVQTLPRLADFLIWIVTGTTTVVSWAEEQWITVFAVGVSVIFLLAAAFVLWWKADLIAAWMSGYDIQDDVKERQAIRIDASLHEIHAVILSCLGAWLSIVTLPRAVGYVVQLATTSPSHATAADGRQILLTAAVAELLLSLLLGAWLLLGARGVVSVLHNARGIGLDRGPAGGQDSSPPST
jgi:hypothetical protein